MKFISLAVATLGALPLVAQASNCKRGLTYCGYILLQRGNYYGQIIGELLAKGQPTDADHVENSLFYCIGGNNGDINFVKYCGAICHDGGEGHNDSC